MANQGYEATTSGEITVYDGNASGDTLAVLEVDALNAGAEATVSYTLPASYIRSQRTDTMNALQFVFTSDTEERNYANDEERIVFDDLGAKWSVVKDSNSVIKVNCADVSIGGHFILSVYDANGKILSVQIQSATKSETQFTISDRNADHIAVFWLDSNYKPLESAVKYSLR